MSVNWKPVLNYEDYYSASDLGDVVRTATQGAKRPSWKPLKVQLLNTGYLRFTLSADGGRKDYTAHRLIWEAFNGPIPEGIQINHMNGTKTDNRLVNLEICSQSQNLLHAYRVLKIPTPNNPSHGSRNGRAKLKEADIPEIISLYRAGGITQAELAKQFSISPTMISYIVAGKHWRTAQPSANIQG